MDKKQNSEKLKRTKSRRRVVRPKTAKNPKRPVTPGKSVNFSSKIQEIISEGESTGINETESDVLKNLLFRKYLKRKVMRELSEISLSSVCSSKKRKAGQLASARQFLTENRNLKNIVDRLAMNIQTTRDVVFDALRYGENQGVVRRVDCGPGESCWIFTPQKLSVNLCRHCSSSDVNTNNQVTTYSKMDSTSIPYKETKSNSKTNEREATSILKNHLPDSKDK